MSPDVRTPVPFRVAPMQVPLSELQHLIDPFVRYQPKLEIRHVFPSPDERIHCCCGCRTVLKGRQRRWASEECAWAAIRMMNILHSNGPSILLSLRRRDGERCAECDGEPEEIDPTADFRERMRQISEQLRLEVDHIVAIADGGGGRDLSNFQLLCKPCHGRKSGAEQTARNLAARQEADAVKLSIWEEVI